jgi:hypothetical protein
LEVNLPIVTSSDFWALLSNVSDWSGLILAQRGSGISGLMVIVTTLPSKLAHIPATGCWA